MIQLFVIARIKLRYLTYKSDGLFLEFYVKCGVRMALEAIMTAQ